MDENKVFKDIIEFIEGNMLPKMKGKAVPYFRDKDLYTPYPVKVENFIDLDSVDGEEFKVIAIDGSNKEIFTTPTYSLQLNRIVVVGEGIYISSEFISLSGLFIEGNEIKYFLKHFHWKGRELFDKEKLVFDAYDSTLSARAFISPPEVVSSLLRRFGEWRMINLAIKILEEKGVERGIILRDGSLRIAISKEDEFGMEAINNIIKSKYHLISVVKRSSLISRRGINMIREMELIGESTGYKRWLYPKIADIKDPKYPADIMFVKPHPYSPPLRIEKPKHDKKDYLPAIKALIKEGEDASVGLGYPYLLARADRESSIKNYEIEEVKTTLYMHSKKIEEEMEIFQDLHERFRRS